MLPVYQDIQLSINVHVKVSNVSCDMWLVNNSTIGLSYCSKEIVATKRGRFDWPKAEANDTVTLPCPNGPNGSMATRRCTPLLNWELPNIDSCATTKVTDGFQSLSQVSLINSYSHV